jgi:hypothetical protein
LIAPGATEARFENNAANDVTVYYHLVISEGQIDSIPVKDVFQRACRLGSHTQTYDRRAGVWLPGNYIVERTGFDKPEASSYCGSVGSYPRMSTLSFRNTVPNGFDQWRKQVHLFIRGGMYVTRLIDSVLGPSDNFADLFLWMLQNSGRVPAALIDQPALLDAATFLEANGFTCNVEIKEATNILDFVANWAPYFLLGESSSGGKKGLRPLLPTNANGTIKVTAIEPEYTFNESLIVEDGFSIEYINYADRLPFVAQLTWRQELGTDAAILRTSQVKFENTSADGPYESYDLSEFCTSEDHAVKIGTYIVVRRATVTHNISFVARPQAHNTILSPGSIIRVVFRRDSSSDAPSVHDYYYQVERITKTLTGDVGYECSHFPIDSEKRSIVSLYVANTVGNGVLFTSNQTGVTCDLPGRDTDDTIPDEEFMPGDDVPGWEWDDDTDTWIPDDDIPGWTWDPDTDQWIPDDNIPGWTWDPVDDTWIPDDDIPGWTWDDGAGEWVPSDDIPGWTWDPDAGEWVLDPLEPFPDPEPDPEPDPKPDPEPDPEPDFPPLDGFDPDIELEPPGRGGIGADINSGAGNTSDDDREEEEEDNEDDEKDDQEDNPFENYPKPGDPNVPPFPTTPAPLVPIPMEGGAAAPGGAIPGPDDWTPGTYTSTVTRISGDFTQYNKVFQGGIPVCPQTPNTSVGFDAGGTTSFDGFAYGLYRYDVPGDCGGSKDFGWWFLLARPGFNPVWTSLGSGGQDAGIIFPMGYTIVNTFVPV